jgi:hypothetical protein
VSEEFINVNVTYNNIQQDYFFINYRFEKKYKLCSTTLFKYDADLIEPFYKYYENQGVEQFYFYNNNYFDINISKEKLQIINWNFKYWNDNCKYAHHAQLGQLNHCLYKYIKPFSEYLLNHDLDEYMYVPNNKLINILNFDLILFNNYWCKSDIIDVPKVIYKSINVNDIHRTKYIVHSKVNALSIHHLKRNNIINNYTQRYYLLHFYNWSNKTRNIDTQFEKFILHY